MQLRTARALVPARTAGDTELAAQEMEEEDDAEGLSRGFMEQSDSYPQQPEVPFQCSRCKVSFEGPEELQSHEDWHMAKDLQDEERGSPAFAQQSSGTRNSSQKRAATSKRGRGPRLEQGQSRLRFG